MANHMDLLNQQIAELQAAASNNAEQIKQLAAQVKEAGGGAGAGRDRSRSAARGDEKMVGYAAVTISAIAVLISAGSLVAR